MTDLTASVAALFAGPVERFVPDRDALVKTLRDTGQADPADEVRALRRPTAAAAALNQVADDPVVAQLCELGEQLRDAQQRVDAAAIRDLSSERTAVLTRLLEALGHPSGTLREQVMATATAALADPAAAAALRSGRLTKALSYSGFGEVDLSDAVARWSAASLGDSATPPPRKTGADRRAAARQARLQQAVAAAQDDVRVADEELSVAQHRHAVAKEALEEARARLRAASD